MNKKLRKNLIDQAMNDWINYHSSFNDYVKDIEGFIEGESTFENIQKKLNNIDFNKHAWQAESLTQIIKIFNADKTLQSLREIKNC
ncbi:hypothetical protein [Kordia sp.]|uniref:hypothetical protein n=1 Tax=Kordia sp. TaxID=1965332 RepID=UPI003D2E21A6